jgi:Tfp pilus assembly protein PilV
MHTARRRRGYLMMEAMVAGSLLTVAIVSTLTMIGSAKADSIYANNLGIAGMLARQRADLLASASNCAPGNQAAFASVSTTHFQFEQRWTVVAAANAASSVPPITTTLCDVTVAVRYPARLGGKHDRLDGTADGQGIVQYRRLYTP